MDDFRVLLHNVFEKRIEEHIELDALRRASTAIQYCDYNSGRSCTSLLRASVLLVTHDLTPV